MPINLYFFVIHNYTGIRFINHKNLKVFFDQNLKIFRIFKDFQNLLSWCFGRQKRALWLVGLRRILTCLNIKVGEVTAKRGSFCGGGLAALFQQTHQKENFGWKPVMLKNRKSGRTCCVGVLAAVGHLLRWGDLRILHVISVAWGTCFAQRVSNGIKTATF